MSTPNFKYMMATEAFLKAGVNISREEPDLVRVYGENEDFYVGEWVTGLGFVGVRFPKSTTRDLTEEDKAYFADKTVVISGIISPLNVGDHDR